MSKDFIIAGASSGIKKATSSSFFRKRVFASLTRPKSGTDDVDEFAKCFMRKSRYDQIYFPLGKLLKKGKKNLGLYFA